MHKTNCMRSIENNPNGKYLVAYMSLMGASHLVIYMYVYSPKIMFISCVSYIFWLGAEKKCLSCQKHIF